MKPAVANRRQTPYDLALFDFDGVLFDTNRAKTEAFRRALEDYPSDLVQQFIDYHETHGGVSRYAKLQYFFDRVLAKPISANTLEITLTRFAEIGSALMSQASPLPGIRDVLTRSRDADIPVAICSGGDTGEISRLLSQHSLLDCFVHIWGNEYSKLEHAKSRIAPYYRHVIFFGDSRYDLEVANAYGFEFVFVSTVTDWKEGATIAQEAGHRVIQDFNDPFLDEIWPG